MKKIIPRDEHSISRKKISRAALDVLYALKEAGFEAYLVGGCVRDLLLGHVPKDFDVVTNALPQQIKSLFRRCYIIGRRFRLAHVYIGRHIIEVATFRKENVETLPANKKSQHGMILRDNVYGTIEDDAFRRDFTINALYYNISDFSIIDFTGGYKDLKNHSLKMIGDPEIRYKEDPVRIIRAIRIASKLDFAIANNTKTPIKKLRHLLANVPKSRLYDEIIKLFLCGYAEKTFVLFKKYELFEQLFPQTNKIFTNDIEKFILAVLKNTDSRINQKIPVNQAFLFATMLWHPILEEWKKIKTNEKLATGLAYETAIRKVVHAQTQVIQIPRRTKLFIREIWILQHRLEQRRPKSIRRILSHPRFRAAFDFLLLRAKVDGFLKPSANWWKKIQTFPPEKQSVMIGKLT